MPPAPALLEAAQAADIHTHTHTRTPPVVCLQVVASSLDSLNSVLLHSFEDRDDLAMCLKASATVPEIAGGPRLHRCGALRAAPCARRHRREQAGLVQGCGLLAGDLHTSSRHLLAASLPAAPPWLPASLRRRHARSAPALLQRQLQGPGSPVLRPARCLLACAPALAARKLPLLPSPPPPPPVPRGHRLVDAAVFEPVPFRSAIADGCTHLLVLCTRPVPLTRRSRVNSYLADAVEVAIKKAVLSPDYMVSEMCSSRPVFFFITFYLQSEN